MRRNNSDSLYQLYNRTSRPSTAIEPEYFFTIVSLTSQNLSQNCTASGNRISQDTGFNDNASKRIEKSPETKPHILHYKSRSSLGSITSIPSVPERIILRNILHSSRKPSKKERFSLKTNQIAFGKISQIQESRRIHHSKANPGKIYISKFICRKSKEKRSDLLSN